MRLYHHKTDGGAEYLCSNAVEGTEEMKNKPITEQDREQMEQIIKLLTNGGRA